MVLSIVTDLWFASPFLVWLLALKFLCLRDIQWLLFILVELIVAGKLIANMLFLVQETKESGYIFWEANRSEILDEIVV